MTSNPTVVFPRAKEVVLENLEVPRPKPGEVLIQTECTMISIGTEMTAFAGEYPKGSAWEKHFNFPYYPGYNNIGVVVQTGEGVSPSLKGKKLAPGGGTPPMSRSRRSISSHCRSRSLWSMPCSLPWPKS